MSIECILDIGNHVISDMGYRKPENNKDIFLVLYENNILDEKIKINLCNMAGFRNILVHDYMKLDRGLVYEIINNNLRDMEEFTKIIIEYV
ncbi:type VII toxin-antitoxin system HepT family RNase toxin [Clostridium sp. WILCCON 0269]|uniref:Type VII toxin-antitoxin system HepT family RNase toxin n=1 Tax=Candidatus Clostridium eludens TaxID=3381663 RepID=A0ABW8SN00_9CLOT